MCNCPHGDEPLETSTPRHSGELSPQDEKERRRQRRSCCKAKRSLTCEDETPVNLQGPPGPTGAPQRNSIPPLRRCELAGVAIVRRRIDFDTSSGKKEQSTADEEAEGKSEGKAEDEEKVEESEKAKEAEEPNAGESSASTPEEDKEGNGATPPACPGQSNPEKDCTCAPKSQ